jgi:hypothetical protein
VLTAIVAGTTAGISGALGGTGVLISVSAAAAGIDDASVVASTAATPVSVLSAVRSVEVEEDELSVGSCIENTTNK